MCKTLSGIGKVQFVKVGNFVIYLNFKTSLKPSPIENLEIPKFAYNFSCEVSFSVIHPTNNSIHSF